jgi:hypothetical protein
MTNIDTIPAAEPNPQPSAPALATTEPAAPAPAAPTQAAAAPVAPPAAVRRGIPGIAVAGIALGSVVVAGLLFGGGVAIGLALPFGVGGTATSISTGGSPGGDSTGRGDRPSTPDGDSNRQMPSAPNTDDTDSEQG